MQNLQCNRIIAESNKSYWFELCKNEVSESKDMYKVWKKVTEMKNGYKLQVYPIKLEHNDFPSGKNKGEIFVFLFSEDNLSCNLNPLMIKFRKEEQKQECQDAIPNQGHYLNSTLQSEPGVF